MKKLQEFSYKRYNLFVYFDKNNKEDTNNLEIVKELLPFFIMEYEKFNRNELLIIKEILRTEINRNKTGKTFMQSFKEIANTDRFILFLKQIEHYYTTYGKDLGLYNGEEIYIDNPDFAKKIKEEIIPIEAISFKEFKKRFLNDIYKTLQWTQEEIEMIKDIIKNFELLNEINVDEIISKELKYILIKEFNLLPQEPEEFLKSLLYMITDDTMVINNQEYLDKITNNMEEYTIQNLVQKRLEDYKNKHGLKELAKIYNRNKNYFIRLKSYDEKNNINTRKYINKIAKLSKIYHERKNQPEYLQISQKIEENILNIKEYNKIISKLDTMYLVKLGNLLNKRIKMKESGLNVDFYAIRNGKYWFKKVNYKGNYQEYLEVLLNELAKRIKNNLNELEQEDIYIDIESLTNYGLVSSGKKFLGNLPFGTLVNGFNVLGVYWENITDNDKEVRIDLDLSLSNVKNKIGWNSDWYEEDKTIVFSGDMTDGKNGATESFYISNDNHDTYILNLNWFNYIEPQTDKTVKVPYTLFWGNINSEKELPTKTIVDNLVLKVNEYIDNKYPAQQLGILIENNFYVGKLLPLVKFEYSNAGINSEELFDSLNNYVKSLLRFENLLDKIDYKYQKNKNEYKTVLDKNNITKDYLIKLFS